MPTFDDHPATHDVSALLDCLAAAEGVESNCMFQLAVMLARIAIEPGAQIYKEEVAQALLGIIRNKPKSNVVRLFGTMPKSEKLGPSSQASA